MKKTPDKDVDPFAHGGRQDGKSVTPMNAEDADLAEMYAFLSEEEERSRQEAEDSQSVKPVQPKNED